MHYKTHIIQREREEYGDRGAIAGLASFLFFVSVSVEAIAGLASSTLKVIAGRISIRSGLVTSIL
ncbi:hypothetical protein HanXRQr2_Chr07g0301971 [Helianthus annuus]|uniref:Uncharacterized protein n=1 Tax=Helianthus annuus TaxID=4232 RepID=A0A251VJ62_HELAN|nr:hypothetical protein HanXRQr2_Chr07g0301971 [Helianthus annuus]KAJ0905287.1 hypothetical protein HanPSC8_Chr07g0292261 [Helianthus annuus]